MKEIFNLVDEELRRLIIQMNYILHDAGLMMKKSELKKENVYKVEGMHSNGGERLVYNELLDIYGESISDYGGDTVYPPTSSGVIEIPMRGVRHYTYYEVMGEDDKTFDLRIYEYVDNDLCYTLHEIIDVKKIRKILPLDDSNFEYKTISDIWKEYDLEHRETALNHKQKKLLNETLEKIADCSDEQMFIIVYNTLRHFMSLNFLKSVYEDLKLREKYKMFLGENTSYESNKFYSVLINNKLSKIEKELLIKINNDDEFIIEKGYMPKILKILISEKNIIDIDIAVGFASKSGLDYIHRIAFLSNNIKNKINLIIGALQNYGEKTLSKRMNQTTAICLNKMINNGEIDLFTYLPSFYHGKYYCFKMEKEIYIIVGSSNISQSAFFNNYELDIFLKLKRSSKEAEEFLNWFAKLKNSCISIKQVDETLYMNDDITEQDNVIHSKSIKDYKNISISEYKNRIDYLDDDEIKYRQQLWMGKNPSAIYDNLGLRALQEYKLYVYKKYKISVFESFKQNNAYYVVDNDNIDEIINELKGKSKTQMFDSELYVVRGYHIKSKEKMEEKINKFFER